MKNLNFPGLPRVLVIDDEEGVREGLRALLQTEGLHVETAAGVDDAVGRLDHRRFDLVFLDIDLPGSDGLAALPRLRVGAQPPDVIVMGGYGHSRFREWVLGGVSRGMLHLSPLPLLVAH